MPLSEVAPELASTPRVDRQWVYNAMMAPLVPALGPARSRSCFGSTTSRGPSSANIKDGKQGLLLRQLVEGPVRSQLTLHIAGLTALRCAAERGETRDPYAAGAHHWLLGPGRRPVLPLRGNPPEAPPRRAA